MNVNIVKFKIIIIILIAICASLLPSRFSNGAQNDRLDVLGKSYAYMRFSGARFEESAGQYVWYPAMIGVDHVVLHFNGNLIWNWVYEYSIMIRSDATEVDVRSLFKKLGVDFNDMKNVNRIKRIRKACINYEYIETLSQYGEGNKYLTVSYGCQ